MSPNTRKKLPLYGVGPFYSITIIAVTVIAIWLSRQKILYYGIYTELKIPLTVLGVLLILSGIYMWIKAVLIDKLKDGIDSGQLITSGIYGRVRNPIYSAFLFVCVGILLMVQDAWLLILPFVFWGFLTLLMIATEEKWLRAKFGKEYEVYCKNVNRVIPWCFKKRHK